MDCFFVQKGVLFTKECIKQFEEVRKFLSKLCISPLTRFAFSYPRGATARCYARLSAAKLVYGVICGLITVKAHF